MISTQKAARFLFYSAWAVIMTALTYILGAASLKVLRRKFGRIGFWGLTTLISMGLYVAQFKVLAIAFYSLVVLIGVFSELEEMGLGFRISAFFTLVINSLIGGGAFAFWVYSTGPKWSQIVLTYLEGMFKPLAEINAQMQINFFELMLVLPSIVVVLWMGAIYVAVLLESKIVTESGPITEGDDAREIMEAAEAAHKALAMRRELSQLRMPDIVVWTFIVGLLGAFGKFGVPAIEAVSANVLNVCFVLFFFQGIGVVGQFFERLKLSTFWQVLFMVLVVLYLFLFVSILGLTDYWFDFRNRLTKRTEEFNREV